MNHQCKAIFMEKRYQKVSKRRGLYTYRVGVGDVCEQMLFWKTDSQCYFYICICMLWFLYVQLDHDMMICGLKFLNNIPVRMCYNMPLWICSVFLYYFITNGIYILDEMVNLIVCLLLFLENYCINFDRQVKCNCSIRKHATKQF